MGLGANLEWHGAQAGALAEPESGWPRGGRDAAAWYGGGPAVRGAEHTDPASQTTSIKSNKTCVVES